MGARSGRGTCYLGSIAVSLAPAPLPHAPCLALPIAASTAAAPPHPCKALVHRYDGGSVPPPTLEVAQGQHGSTALWEPGAWYKIIHPLLFSNPPPPPPPFPSFLLEPPPPPPGRALRARRALKRGPLLTRMFLQLHAGLHYLPVDNRNTNPAFLIFESDPTGPSAARHSVLPRRRTLLYPRSPPLSRPGRQASTGLQVGRTLSSCRYETSVPWRTRFPQSLTAVAVARPARAWHMPIGPQHYRIQEPT
jgi:hypothetical protein